MLVVHGLWSMSGSLRLWAEDSDLLVKSPSQQTGAGGAPLVGEDSAVVTCCGRVRCGGIIFGVRRGCPRKRPWCFEPVSQHGGGGLPREPWIGALSPCVRLATFLPSPRRTPSHSGLREKGAAQWTSFTRAARAWTFRRRTPKCASASTVPVAAKPAKRSPRLGRPPVRSCRYGIILPHSGLRAW